MGRLPGFDYKRPFFYMVTVKGARSVPGKTGFVAAAPQLQFSRLEEGGALADTALTPALRVVIEHFHETWWCIERIRYYVIMPDHLHLIIKMRDVEGRVSLAVVVRQLIKALERAAGGAPAKPVVQGALRAPIFEKDWHDWIVKKEGQLDTFRRYIAENGHRAWLRRENRRFFTEVRRVNFAGREWRAYGNAAILELPVIAPFQCSRKWTKDGPEWREAMGRAERLGPGGAGVGTFMSPCEKECGNAIFKAGGSLIVLYPEGFGERWHPPRNKEALCAKGRMLFLSLWEASTKKPDNATLYKRCHEMGTLASVAKAGKSAKTQNVATS
ncbi:MAG: hypothetical protein IKO72_01170 [Kiritimatiellae bacterium]|nr:hypothetical protein [Kiritimatiellia bacterium]